MSEKRYTLDEVAKIRRLDECVRQGHSWNIITAYPAVPLKIVCEICGWAGSVRMGDRPARPEGVTA